MTPQELEQFVDNEKKLSRHLDKTVRIIHSAGWSEGYLRFKHIWFVESGKCRYEFDPSDVAAIHSNYIYLH